MVYLPHCHRTNFTLPLTHYHFTLARLHSELMIIHASMSGVSRTLSRLSDDHNEFIIPMDYYRGDSPGSQRERVVETGKNKD